MDGPRVKSAAADSADEGVFDDDDREPTKEEILEDLRIALRDAIAGKNLRPAREVLDEIDRELADDANAR